MWGADSREVYLAHKEPIGRLLAKTDDVCLHHFGLGGAVVEGGGGASRKMVAATPYLNLLDSYLYRFRFRPERSSRFPAVVLSLLVSSGDGFKVFVVWILSRLKIFIDERRSGI